MPSAKSPAAAPSTLPQFLEWLKQRQNDLWDLRERHIGGSGKIALATGKRYDDPGPAIVEVNLHQPSGEYLVLRDFLDCVDKLCPAEVADEFRQRWPRERFVIVRDLIHAIKWVEGRLNDKPEGKACGRIVERDEHNARKLVWERWQKFKREYKTVGYNRCSYENFAAWANDKFDDMPSDDAAKLEQLVNAYKKTPKPRNLK